MKHFVSWSYFDVYVAERVAFPVMATGADSPVSFVRLAKSAPTHR
jgi:hypothetical protein